MLRPKYRSIAPVFPANEITRSRQSSVSGLMLTYPVHQAADIPGIKGNLATRSRCGRARAVAAATLEEVRDAMRTRY
jgi:hypothetical protein